VFPVRYGQTYRVELSFKCKIGRSIMYRRETVILIYHHQMRIDLKKTFAELIRRFSTSRRARHHSPFCNQLSRVCLPLILLPIRFFSFEGYIEMIEGPNSEGHAHCYMKLACGPRFQLRTSQRQLTILHAATVRL
jgi:hypothetical protein